MRYARITKIFRFEAAHQLPAHQGKCARLHGHSYKLEVTLRGPVKDAPGESDHGMVMDFAALARLTEEAILSRLDHQNINAVTGIYTTAENLVYWIWQELLACGLEPELLYAIRLWETETSFAEITRQEGE
jgi:6-pyruvoyltetrahydropterin/6-carboxytetrahydropterin synthase